jgi:hypothetical protein
MIVDTKKKWIQTLKGCHGFTQKTISPLQDLIMVWAIFYNPAIPSGLRAAQGK